MKTNNKVEHMFPFNESSEIRLMLKLSFKRPKNKKPVIIEAAIKYQDGKLLLYAEEYLKDEKINNHLLSIFTLEFNEDFYEIQDAKVKDLSIELNKVGTIRFVSYHLDVDKKVISMELKTISYSFVGTSGPVCYRMSNIASTLLVPDLTGLAAKGGIVVGTIPTVIKAKCFNRHISLSRDDKFAYLKVKDNVADILSVLSFFFCSPIEYDMSFSSNKEGMCIVEVIPPSYKVIAMKKNEILGYLFCNNINISSIISFLEVTENSGRKLPLSDLQKRYIDSLVRAEYLDNISKLLLYETIIERMAGVKKKDKTYTVIRQYLEKKHIRVDKINDHVLKNIIKNEEGNNIRNFVQLRNFFVHHLGSKDAIAFLQESNMLFYLKEAVSVLILEEMGIKGVQFDKAFHGISVFDKKVDESDTISIMFKE